MGAIQQAINQMTSSALGAAVGVKAAQMADEQKKANEIQKQIAEKEAEAQRQEKEFNATMKQAEMPVQQAELKLAQAEAKKDLGLEENTLNYQKKAEEIYKVKNEILKTEKGEMNPDRYEAIAEHRMGQLRGETRDKENLIKLNYSKEKIKLSKELHQAQVAAKQEQSRLITERIKQLKGGVK